MHRLSLLLMVLMLFVSCEERSQYITGYGPGINLPSAFTPNDDGINDTFLPIFDFGVVVTTYQMKIYTSDYQEVFTTTDSKEAWTGKNSDGKTLPATSYYCRVYGTYDSGEKYDVSSMVELLLP